MRIVLIFLAVVLVFGAAVAAEPLNRIHAPGEYLKPAETVAAMTLPEGFRAQLFAGEPDVAQPIAFCMDARGRLWIVENYSYLDWKPEGKDRIIILEDTDGDGVHDVRKVFWQGANFATGIEVGFGGVFLGSPPNLMFIPDRDGDDKPDAEPEVLLDGWGHHDTHETMNSFIWGPDGWLYGCQGVFTQSNIGKPGTPDGARVPLNAGIWRYHPVMRDFEVFAEGGSNQWGVDFNDQGQAFMTACVIPHLFHVVQGGRYHRQAGQHFNPHTFVDIKTIRTHEHYAAAFAGAMVYLGDNFPESCRNQLFMNNIHASKVHMDLLEPKGSGYVGKLGPYDVRIGSARENVAHDDRGSGFLNNGDKWYRGLCLRTGPDGGVFINDWYDQRPCHQLRPHDQDMSFYTGRIYKITYTDVGGPKRIAGIDLSKTTNEELIQYQLHRNDWYVRTARRVLQERHATGVDMGDAIEELHEIVQWNKDPTRLLRAMWALHAIGEFDEGMALNCLKRDGAHVRAWAIQLALEDFKVSPDFLDEMVFRSQNDKSPVVRLSLASACQRMTIADRWLIVRNLVAHGEDAEDHNLPAMYWYAAEPIVGLSDEKAVELLEVSRIPMIRQYIARRMTAKD